MKIGIYVLGLRPATAGGVEIYFRNLIKNISKYDTSNEYFIFLGDRQIKKVLSVYKSPKIKLIYYPRFYIAIYLVFLFLLSRPQELFKLVVNRLSRILFSRGIFNVRFMDIYSEIFSKVLNFDRYKLDVVHFPFTTISQAFFNLKTPIVLTIHDIQQEYYPEYFDEKTMNIRNQLYRPSAGRADMIIAISEATKKSLVEKYGINPEKIIVAYQGCAEDFKKIDDVAILNRVQNQYSLPDEFMLYPASTWPHKNHVRLFEAMSILKKRYSFEKKLILTGIPMNNHNSIMETVDRLNLRDQVVFLHFVPFCDMPVLYNLATVIVYPSLFEGFGIPLVEAMNVGLPIVCSDRTSIPEIAGDAGIYFNPDNTEDIAEKIYQIWKDESLRNSLIERGFERAKMFTWENGLKKTVEAYRIAAGGG